MHLKPLTADVLAFMRAHGSITALDAMRAFGSAGGSLTSRLSELRRAGYEITRSVKKDPVTGAKYGVWKLAKQNRKRAA